MRIVGVLLSIGLLLGIGTTCLGGGQPLVSTVLASDITDQTSTILVTNTNGFNTEGIIIINSEVIEYESKTATTFIVKSRGFRNTTATDHKAIVEGTSTKVVSDALGEGALALSEFKNVEITGFAVIDTIATVVVNTPIVIGMLVRSASFNFPDLWKLNLLGVFPFAYILVFLISGIGIGTLYVLIKRV